MLRSLVEQPHFDYPSLDDPDPFFADLWSTVSRIR